MITDSILPRPSDLTQQLRRHAENALLVNALQTELRRQQQALRRERSRLRKEARRQLTTTHWNTATMSERTTPPTPEEVSGYVEERTYPLVSQTQLLMGALVNAQEALEASSAEIRAAVESDGMRFERISDRPVFSPSLDGPDAGCVDYRPAGASGRALCAVRAIEAIGSSPIRVEG